LVEVLNNFLASSKIFISKGLVEHKQVKISDKKEQGFGDIVTPFLSSNAKRYTVRKFAQD